MRISDIEKEKAKVFLFACNILLCLEIPNDPFKNIKTNKIIGIVTAYKINFLKLQYRASLVAQWLRIHLPMQGTRVRALVWEDPTRRGATGPVSHNY